MTCKICSRTSDKKYCDLHEKAYKNLVKNYDNWKKAMKISWDEYVDAITDNSYTGSWVRDVTNELKGSAEG